MERKNYNLFTEEVQFLKERTLTWKGKFISIKFKLYSEESSTIPPGYFMLGDLSCLEKGCMKNIFFEIIFDVPNLILTKYAFEINWPIQIVFVFIT